MVRIFLILFLNFFLVLGSAKKIKRRLLYPAIATIHSPSLLRTSPIGIILIIITSSPRPGARHMLALLVHHSSHHPTFLTRTALHGSCLGGINGQDVVLSLARATERSIIVGSITVCLCSRSGGSGQGGSFLE